MGGQCLPSIYCAALLAKLFRKVLGIRTVTRNLRFVSWRKFQSPFAHFEVNSLEFIVDSPHFSTGQTREKNGLSM